MHYFSIHTQQGEHLGFFIMLPDDESEQPPSSGRFAVKRQSEHPPQNTAAAQVVARYGRYETPLYWKVEKDHVVLFDDEAPLGRLRNEYLNLDGHTFVLNNLTGTL